MNFKIGQLYFPSTSFNPPLDYINRQDKGLRRLRKLNSQKLSRGIFKQLSKDNFIFDKSSQNIGIRVRNIYEYNFIIVNLLSFKLNKRSTFVTLENNFHLFEHYHNTLDYFTEYFFYSFNNAFLKKKLLKKQLNIIFEKNQINESNLEFNLDQKIFLCHEIAKFIHIDHVIIFSEIIFTKKENLNFIYPIYNV